jgi:hypothetical protein
VLQRWATRRFFQEDAAGPGGAAALEKHLLEQGFESPGTEPFAGADRADVFTFHHKDGRGVRWKNTPREMLWLCAFDARHDQGYAHAEQLQESGQLYPGLDPAWVPGTQTLAPWETWPDEDNYEWSRLIYGALETWDINASRIAAGDEVNNFPSSLFLSLRKAEEDIWTLLIRRNFAYLNGSARDRFLTNDEMLELLHHIAKDEADLQYEVSAPPADMPHAFLFAQFDFLGGPVAPRDWLKRVAKSAGKNEPLQHITV